MPRRSPSTNLTSAVAQVEKQARSLLVNLRNEIRSKESELRWLKHEESRLSQVARRVGDGAAPAAAREGRGRINWRAVLEHVPKQFKASDIRNVRGLKNKRPSEIFAAITRWIDAGLVRRKARGRYERA